MKNKKGFTLVELLVVIAVIAILVAVIVPTSIYFVDKANASKELQQMDVLSVVRGEFIGASETPFDLSSTTENQQDQFLTKLSNNDLPYSDLGKIEVTVTGRSDNWKVAYTLKGQEYADKGATLSASLDIVFSNDQIFKGCTKIPTKDTTYIYVIDKSNGNISLIK